MGHASEHVYVARFPKKIHRVVCVSIFMRKGENFHLRFLFFISVAFKVFSSCLMREKQEEEK